jgi:hypothetical protein
VLPFPANDLMEVVGNVVGIIGILAIVDILKNEEK